MLLKNDCLVLFSRRDLFIIAFLSALDTSGAWLSLSIFFFSGACLFKAFKNISSNLLHETTYSRENIQFTIFSLSYSVYNFYQRDISGKSLIYWGSPPIYLFRIPSSFDSACNNGNNKVSLRQNYFTDKSDENFYAVLHVCSEL